MGDFGSAQRVDKGLEILGARPFDRPRVRPNAGPIARGDAPPVGFCTTVDIATIPDGRAVGSFYIQKQQILKFWRDPDGSSMRC